MKQQMYAFDTHKAVKELTEAGAKPPLAEAMVSTLGTMVENLPTRQDLQTELGALRKDFDASKREIDAKLVSLREEFKAGNAALREEIDAKLGFFQEGNDVKFDYIKKDIAALREELDTKLAALREELKADNVALREELKARLDLFDAKARNREIRMIIVLGLIVFSALGLLIAFLTPFLS